jgi:hypothetical protein
MAKIDLMVVGYHQNDKQLRSKDSLHAFCQELVKRSFSVYAFLEKFEDSGPNNTPITPHISQKAKQAIDSFNPQEQPHFTLQAHSPAHIKHAFDFGIQLSPSEKTSIISISDGYLTTPGEEDKPDKYERWLDVVSLFYQTWSPFYGFQSSYCYDDPKPLWEDAQKKKADWLYDITLFGPDYVSHIGQKRLMSAPAWRIIPMKNKGIILATAPYVTQEPHYDRKKIAEHLGLRYE